MEGSIDLSGRHDAFVQLELAIQHSRGSGKRLLIALVDLDRFHRINASRGTGIGNYVLQTVSERLSDIRMEGSESALTVSCRLGGDSFLVIASMDGKEPEQCCFAAEMIKNAVERPVVYERDEIYLTASIGACQYPQDGRTSEQLICRAEAALSYAKEQGGNRTQFFNEDDTKRMNRRIAIEQSLRPALLQRQFYLSYQPIYRLSDGRIRGIEALIRWQHPELGTVTPHEFIPVAEHNGLIVPIGEWVLREACKTLAGMRRYGMDGIIMSINISPVQLSDSSFTHTLLNIVQEHALPADAIELELTEHFMLHASEASIAALTRIRAAGVRISLDDFGTGYSSFVSLKQLPVHCVKIDKTFIKRIDLQSAERHIVESIIGLMKKLGLEVIAEGVEFEEQYALLRKWGCHYVQGFLLGKPMEPSVIDMTMLPGIMKPDMPESSHLKEEMPVETFK